MDTDAADATNGVGDSINGETKHDHAKLAQQAIIKQDVMLSGTSTQSPVSSVLTMPTVTMPTGSIVSTSMGATSLTGAIPENLFMSVGHESLSSIPPFKTEAGAGHTLLSHSSLAAQQAAQQAALLGQPQVAPQFILAGQPATQGQGQMPVQHLLIPVSTGIIQNLRLKLGNGTQQLLSIPVSLAAGAGNQIQLLTTSNGQLIATNLASLAQPLNFAVNATGAGAQSVTNTHGVNVTSSIPAQVSSPQPSVQAVTTPVPQQAGSMPQIITNAQGQIVAIGAPQSMFPSAIPANQAALTNGIGTQSPLAQPVASPSISQSQPSVQLATSAGTAALPQNQPSLAGSGLIQSVPTTVASQASMSQMLAQAALPQSVSQLLPNTISSATESTTVDGINLDEIKEFARQFKIRRLSLGLTQTQVGQALSALEGPSYSQSAICRFEKLDITPKSAQKIKPVLERWMLEAEERYKNGVQNLTEFIGSEPSKKRKRRTSFTPQALEFLNEHFERNTHPSGTEMAEIAHQLNSSTEMTELAQKLNYDREVIRVWFCNKRQALKNTIKKLKAVEGPP